VLKLSTFLTTVSAPFVFMTITGLRRVSRSLFLGLFLTASLTGLTAQANNSCSDLFLSSSPDGISIYRKFISSGLLLETATFRKPPLVKSFAASNEYDWASTPWDESPTDVVLGFGTNSAWDIAVRKNAKALVLGDIVGEPLYAQNYLLRPLLLIAESRADFLSMLAGFELPPELKASGEPIENVFDYLVKKTQGYVSGLAAQRSRSVTERDRQSFAEMRNERLQNYALLINRLRQDKRITPDQIYMVNAYTSALVTGGLDRKDAAFLGGVYSHWVYSGERYDLFLSAFNQRYNPRLLVEQGAPRNLVEHPFFSTFASDEAFKRLQYLFNGHIYYVGAELREDNLYQTLRSWGDQKGYRDYTLSISNIIDVVGGNPAEVLSQYQNQVRQALSTPGHPVILFQTQGVKTVHTYSRHELH